MCVHIPLHPWCIACKPQTGCNKLNLNAFHTAGELNLYFNLNIKFTCIGDFVQTNYITSTLLLGDFVHSLSRVYSPINSLFIKMSMKTMMQLNVVLTPNVITFFFNGNNVVFPLPDTTPNTQFHLLPLLIHS